MGCSSNAFQHNGIGSHLNGPHVNRLAVSHGDVLLIGLEAHVSNTDNVVVIFWSR